MHIRTHKIFPTLFFLLLVLVCTDQSTAQDQSDAWEQSVAHALWQHGDGQLFHTDVKPDTAIGEFQGCATDDWPNKYSCMGVALIRGGCGKGPCPLYELQLNGDGRVFYEGLLNTKIKGERTGRIDPVHTHLIYKFILDKLELFAGMEDLYLHGLIVAGDYRVYVDFNKDGF